MRKGLLTAALCGLALCGQAAAAESQRPNILVILVDDLGYGDLSSYGAQDLKTPHIDSLIGAGMRFGNFYANCPVCSPTRASLLSGKYPDTVGVPGVIRTHADNSWGYLSPDAVLLPRAVKKGGYYTGAIGKWHLGLDLPSYPNSRGFDFFHGFLGDMMDDYYHHRRHGVAYMRRNTDPVEPKGHATDVFTDWAIEFFNARKQDGGNWFLYLAYNAPHTPIQPPDDWLAKVKAREPGISDQRAKLVALIEHLDAGVGRVVEALKTNGQYDSTLIIFTSDNGGQLSVGANCGNLRGGKQNMYEGGIRVPMGAVWPGRIQAGSRSDAVAMAMDIYPTVCEAAGVAPPRDIDGVSMLPVLLGKTAEMPERDLVWVRREGGGEYQGQDYHALRRGDWKLLRNTPFETYQLFNLRDDPQEKNDLARQEPQRYRNLSRALMQHIQRAERTPWQKAWW